MEIDLVRRAELPVAFVVHDKRCGGSREGTDRGRDEGLWERLWDVETIVVSLGGRMVL